ncbi:MAG TPA: GNAT family N-acetyltransferase [Candidatus Methanoperedens sp.]|nr:GNAT family N-acetyltransferase [Candidatus Methanoperedens sp.]
MHNYTIRLLTSVDYPSIKNIDEQTQIQYLGQDKWGQLSPSKKKTHLVSRQPNYNGFVKSGYSFLIEDATEILGFIFAYETIPMYGEVYCEYIAIKPSFQGQGLGRQLYKKLLEVAKKNKIKRVWSLINLDNPNSIKAHEKVGFKLSDRKEAVFKVD